MAAFANSGFQVIEHLMYSQDLTLSDFRLFSKLKEHIFGKRFSSDEEVVDAVIDWFAGIGEKFFLEAVKMLESWCEKCIHIQGDYRIYANIPRIFFLEFSEEKLG